MHNTNTIQGSRGHAISALPNSKKKTLIDFLLSPVSLLTAVLAPAFVVCLATGSILLFAAIVFNDAMGATLGVMLYQKAKPIVISILPPKVDESQESYELPRAA